MKRYNVFRGKHVCGVNFCSGCHENHSVNEFCYMNPLKNDESRKKSVLFVFYDFEARQEDVYQGDETVRIHVPNLSVAQQVCNECMDMENDFTNLCASCDVREYIFKVDPVNELLNLYFREKTKFDHTRSA